MKKNKENRTKGVSQNLNVNNRNRKSVANKKKRLDRLRKNGLGSKGNVVDKNLCNGRLERNSFYVQDNLLEAKI